MIRASYGFLKKEKLLPHKHWTRFNCFRLCNNTYLIFKRTKISKQLQHKQAFNNIQMHRSSIRCCDSSYPILLPSKLFRFFFSSFLFVFKSNSGESHICSALYRPFAGSRDQSHGMTHTFSFCKHLIFSVFKMFVVLLNNLLIVDSISKLHFSLNQSGS